MKILLHHAVVLPARHYGGVERVVLWLAKGLVEAGHDVTIACDPSSHLPPSVRHLKLRPGDELSAEFQRLIRRFDVIHFMAPPPTACLPFEREVPFLVTIHGNGSQGEVFHPNSVFLSSDHAQRHGRSFFVYNGVDPTELSFSIAASDRYLFLSKTSWRVKNLKGAIRLCEKARVPLVVSGGTRPWNLQFRVRLNKLFRDQRWHWAGAIGGAEKADLLASSRALVFPILWSEPFGLVMVEAMMSGTPVLAPPLGSVREIVTAETGLILATEQDWLKALDFDSVLPTREGCRKAALERFHYSQMTENYVRLYQKIQSGQRLDLGIEGEQGL